jgi:hypothetical protein
VYQCIVQQHKVVSKSGWEWGILVATDFSTGYCAVWAEIDTRCQVNSLSLPPSLSLSLSPVCFYFQGTAKSSVFVITATRRDRFVKSPRECSSCPGQCTLILSGISELPHGVLRVDNTTYRSVSAFRVVGILKNSRQIKTKNTWAIEKKKTVPTFSETQQFISWCCQ